MIDSEQCMTILAGLNEKFEERIQKIKELKLQVQAYLSNSQNHSNERMASKLNKELLKIKKHIEKEDSKILGKQERLLNSNHLDELEREIIKNTKLLGVDDGDFVLSLEGLVEEAKDSEFVDELQFTLNYLEVCEKSTTTQKEIYEKQLNFLNEVFEEQKEQL